MRSCLFLVLSVEPNHPTHSSSRVSILAFIVEMTFGESRPLL